MAKRLESIFTDDMNCCMFTGSSDVERHHILYNTSNQKKLCEKYKFIVPLRRDIHPNGVSFNPKSEELRRILDNLGEESMDEYLKKECEKHYLQNYGTVDEWREEFGKNYLEEEEIALWSERN